MFVKFITSSLNLTIRSFSDLEYIPDLTLNLNLFGKFEGCSCVNTFADILYLEVFTDNTQEPHFSC